MSLSDVVGHADLALFPQIAMVLFLAVFVSVAVRVLRRAESDFEDRAHLPLEGEEVSP